MIDNEYDCIHDEKVWVIKIGNEYFYQPNQGSLICGNYLRMPERKPEWV